MADIFLSYARADRDRARQLADALGALGWSVWWDRQIPTGQDFGTVIEKQLHTARCIIVLWSASSISSHYVKDEATEGFKDDRLVPCRIDDIEPPLGFRQFQTANLIDWQDDSPHEEFERFVESIAALIPRAKKKRRGKKNEPAATDGDEVIRGSSPIIENAVNSALSSSPTRASTETKQTGTGMLTGRQALFVLPCSFIVGAVVWWVARIFTSNSNFQLMAASFAFVTTIVAFANTIGTSHGE